MDFQQVKKTFIENMDQFKRENKDKKKMKWKLPENSSNKGHMKGFQFQV